MDIQADFVAYDSERKPVLVVEVRNKTGTNSEWAARTRRNMLAHGLIGGDIPYFLLALPDRFYLWKDNFLLQPVKPDYEIDPSPYLMPYLANAGISVESLSGQGFELLIASWLNELLQQDSLPLVDGQNDQWLIESGLFDAIRKGYLVSEFA